MTNIALMELSTHPEHLAHLLKISNKENYERTVFTTEDNREEVRPLVSKGVLDDVEWQIKGDENESAYFRQIVEICNSNVDILINVSPFDYNTFYKNLYFCQFDPNCKKICYLYNTRTWDRPSTMTGRLLSTTSPSMTSHFDAVLKYFRHLLIPEIRSNYDSFLVEHNSLKKYLDSSNTIKEEIYTLLPVVFEGTRKDVNSKKTHVVIPGRANNNLREYDIVFDVLSQYWESRGCDDLEVSILGNAKDAVKEQSRVLSERGYPIEYFTEYIDQEKYTNTIQSSDIVLNPLRKVFNRSLPGASHEIRGKTKGSGIILDAIQFGKPLILPSHFRPTPELDGMVKQYQDTSELMSILHKSSGTKRYIENWKVKATSDAKQFDMENQQKRFNQIINDSLSVPHKVG